MRLHKLKGERRVSKPKTYSILTGSGRDGKITQSTYSKGVDAGNEEEPGDDRVTEA